MLSAVKERKTNYVRHHHITFNVSRFRCVLTLMSILEQKLQPSVIAESFIFGISFIYLSVLHKILSLL